MTGWADANIHEFLLAMEKPSSSMAYALITCLDSNLGIGALASVAKHFDDVRSKPRVVGKGLSLTTRKLLDAERRERIFFGFDEIWFSAKPITLTKPKGLVITGPERLRSELVDEHCGWLDASGCTLWLGDGTGMNFCLRVRGLAKRIVSALNEACEATESTVLLR